MSGKKLVLLTNDDGISSPSLLKLYDMISSEAECVVVAPAEEHSAMSHAISLHKEIKASAFKRNGVVIGHQVWGTPADCVKLALCELLDRKPDLVVSGINYGANVGVSIYYSGTVSAAREGAILGIPSLALSIVGRKGVDIADACDIGFDFVRSMLMTPVNSGTIVNVNIPHGARSNMKGVKLTHQARSYFREWFVKTREENEQRSFILEGEIVVSDRGDAVDVHSLDDGYVTVTPLKMDMTDYEVYPDVRMLVSQVTQGERV